MTFPHSPPRLAVAPPHEPHRRVRSNPAAPWDRAALAAIPEHPRTTPLTAERWAQIIDGIRSTQPVLAELSFFTAHLWHGGADVQLSRMGGFLIAQFTDAPRQAMVVSLPGAILSPLVRTPLAEFIAAHQVRFVSERTLAALEPVLAQAGVRAVARADDADYVLELRALASLDGPALRSKRRAAGRLERRHAVEVREGRLDETWANEHLIRAYDRWCIAKYGAVSAVPAAVAYERRGLFAWPRGAAAAGVRVFSLLVDGAPAGVSVVEPMWNATWMGIVFKTDPGIPGATAYLRQHVAKAGLRDVGESGLLNIQQDDGLPGLERAKRSWAPVRLEPKYALLPVGDSIQDERAC